jgi:hypothetical protein
MMFRTGTVALALLLAPPAPAAVLVLANATGQPIPLSLDRGAGAPDSVTLAPGESRPFPVGKHATVAYVIDGASATLRLDAWQAYVFTKPKGAVSLSGVALAGKPVALTDVSERPAVPGIPTVKLKVYADDANPFTRAVWEPKLKRRVTVAAALLTVATGVAFDVEVAGTWKSDAEADTLDKLLTDFENKVRFEKGVVHVGFANRPALKPNDPAVPSLGKALAPLRPHVLIRDGAVRSEPEMVELVAHELGHWLGAVVTPDADSVMRAKLGDGRAILATHKLRFDPLNLLAMNLWASELSSGKVKTWQDLKPETQSRLARVYETLATADPAEKQSEALTALVAAANPGAVAAAPAVPNAGNAPNAPSPARPQNTKEEAVRRVLRGLAIRAADNAAKPEGQRLSGDALTVELIKTAADVAGGEEEAMQVPAFAVGVGLGLDDSTVLRGNPLTKQLAAAVETDREFQARAAAVAGATLWGRRDLCQHFVVSCGLADLIGPDLARQAGLAKEFRDTQGPGGFSFADLCVDYGGVEFVERLKKDKHLLGRVKQNFRVADYVPKIDGLSEGLRESDFKARYGTAGDPRFKAAVAEIETRVKGLGGYAK